MRLEFLDGLRGLAALWVLVSHACQMVHIRYRILTDQLYRMDNDLPSNLLRALPYLEVGHYAVDIFIVLSGFCLMLPVVRSASSQLKGGFSCYIKRRARRILPPYYAALLLSLALILLVPALRQRTGELVGMDVPAFTPGVLISHLLLVHNFSAGWTNRIDGPMWSVATEWQIYFVFALLLLPVWRRYGMMAAILAAYVVGKLPSVILHRNIDWACFWFVGLFALGMAGAVMVCPPARSKFIPPERVPWGALTAASGILLILCLQHNFWGLRDWLRDWVVALATMCLIVYCGRSALSETSHTPLLRFLSSRWAVKLGTFSYSIYLVHYPLLGIANALFLQCHPTPIARLALMLAVAAPISVLAAYGFHLVFERPFMSGAPRSNSTESAKVI